MRCVVGRRLFEGGHPGGSAGVVRHSGAWRPEGALRPSWRAQDGSPGHSGRPAQRQAQHGEGLLSALRPAPEELAQHPLYPYPYQCIVRQAILESLAGGIARYTRRGVAVAYDALACVARVLGGRLSDPALAGLVLPALAHKFTAAPLADRVGAGCRVARTVGLWGTVGCGAGARSRVGDLWEAGGPAAAEAASVRGDCWYARPEATLLPGRALYPQCTLKRAVSKQLGPVSAASGPFACPPLRLDQLASCTRYGINGTMRSAAVLPLAQSV